MWRVRYSIVCLMFDINIAGSDGLRFVMIVALSTRHLNPSCKRARPQSKPFPRSMALASRNPNVLSDYRSSDHQ